MVTTNRTARERATAIYRGLLERAGLNQHLAEDSPLWQTIDAQACDLAWLAVYGVDGNCGQHYRAEAQSAK